MTVLTSSARDAQSSLEQNRRERFSLVAYRPRLRWLADAGAVAGQADARTERNGDDL